MRTLLILALFVPSALGQAMMAAMGSYTPPLYSSAGQDDTLTNWNTCGLSCAGGTGTGTSVTQTINNASPSVDGAAMQFSVTGPSLSMGQTTNQLWYFKPGAQNTATAMVGTYSCYISSTALIAALEFDQFIFTHSPIQERDMFGSECDIGGNWRIWNQLTTSWVSTATACSLNVGSFNTIQWITHRIPGNTGCSGHSCLYYDQLTVNGVASGPYTPQPSNTSADADNIGFQFQIDVNATGGAVTASCDKLSLAVY